MGAACSSEVPEQPHNLTQSDLTVPNDDINNTNLLAIKYFNSKYTPVFKYDNVQDSWSEIASIPLEGFYSVTLAGGQFYFIKVLLFEIYCYNPITRSIRQIEPLKNNLTSFCTTEFQHKLVIVGSLCKPQAVRMWDADKGHWLTLPKLLVGRMEAAAVEHDGYLYVAGGKSTSYAKDQFADFRAVERYSPSSRSWRRCADLIQARTQAKLVSVRGYIYCVGGIVGSVPTNMVERYDPRINKWIELSCMLSPKSYIGCAYFQYRLLVAGGPTFDEDCAALEEYDEQRNVWLQRNSTEIWSPKNLFVVSMEFLQKLQPN